MDTNIITEEQIDQWIGPYDARDFIISLIYEIANGDYQPEELKEDILNSLKYRK
tara:strand:+ start:920 stop:1081 length:162 start_codon:yes stop_codon:yes gene_type:complete